ncbi:MAG: phage major tail tube protein [Hyphomicrobiaceae bacterium]|nr:phage major tail tube protein [Rhodobiaceae bacterium]MCB1549968.1 phage major tail tube protein [Hyphomicrobiaceae bacterium]MCC0019190.1 phage major tail tube protein [Rhodobiaceae bacterium]MCC0054350.1 phage major tail tube protein [Rhodobiaceae bacterium]
MLHLVGGFNLFLPNFEFGIVTEEVTVAAARDKTEGYYPGTFAAEVNVPVGVEALAAKIKTVGQHPELYARTNLPPGERERLTVRGYLYSETEPNETEFVTVIEGRLNPNPEPWRMGSKSGVEWDVSSIFYMRHETGGVIIHEYDLLGGGHIIRNGAPVGRERRRILGMTI